MKQNISLLLCHILFIFASEWIICRSDRPDARRYLSANNYLNEENSYDRADPEGASFVNRYYSAAYADRTRALDDSYSIDRERKEVAEDRSDLNPSLNSEYLRSAYSKPRNTIRNGEHILAVAASTATSDGSTSNDVILNETNLAAVASKLFAGGDIAGEIKLDHNFYGMPEDVYSHTYSMMKLSPGKCMCEGIDGTQSFFSINGSNDINFHFNGVTGDDSNAKINMFNKGQNAFFNFDTTKSFNSMFDGKKSTQFGTQFESNFNVDGNARLDVDYISNILLNLVSDGKLAVTSFSSLSAEQLKELYKRIFINMQIDAQNKIDAQAVLQLIAQINAEAKAQAEGDVNSQAWIQTHYITQGQTDAQTIAQAQAELDAQIQAQAQAQLDAQLQAQGQANANINANKAISVEVGGGGGLFGKISGAHRGVLGFGGLIGGGLNGGLNGGMGGEMGGGVGGGIGGGMGGGIGGGIGGAIGGGIKGAMGGGVGGGIGGGAGGGIGGGIGGGMGGGVGGGMVGGVGGGMSSGFSGAMSSGFSGAMSGGLSGAMSGHGGAGEEFHMTSRFPFYRSSSYTSDGLRGVSENGQSHRDHTFGPYGGDGSARY